MTKLDERFEALSRTRAPDLWGEIERREPREPVGLGPSPSRRAAVALLALAIAIAGTTFAVRAFREGRVPATAPTTQRIAFSALRDGDWDLYSMAPDGSDNRRLTDTPEAETDPTWSSDGTRIAYAFGPGEQDAASTSIRSMPAWGGAAVELVPPRAYGPISTEPNPVGQPSWSPVGDDLAFTVYGDGGGIYLRDAAGDVRRLTEAGPPTGHVDSDPAWLPDGSGLLFLRWSLDGGRFSILRVDPDGGEPSVVRVRLDDLPSESDVSGLSVSPAGRVLFSRADVYSMAADGSGLTRLTDTPDLIEFDPSWSPDGRGIVFSAELGDRFADLYAMDADGANVRRLTDDPGIEHAAAWGVAAGAPTSSPPPAAVDAVVTHTIDVGAFPNAVAVGEGGVWVSSPRNDGSGGGAVVRIDPETGEVAARIPVDSLPGWVSGGGGMAVGEGRVWVLGSRGVGERCCVAFVQEIDPRTNEVVAVIELGPGTSGGDVWVDASGLWAVYSTPTDDAIEVAHADPRTHEVLARFTVPGQSSQTIFGMGGAIWVSALAAGTDGAFGGPGSQALIHRIAPASHGIDSRACGDCWWSFPDPSGPWAVVEGGIQRFDPASGTLTGKPILLSEDCCDGPFVADGGGGVWVSDLRVESEGRAIWHLSAEGTVDAVIDVDGRELAQLLAGVAYGFDAATQTIWVVHYRDTVSRVALT